jgi:hypothetical protein
MCSCGICTEARAEGAYVSATYHHGLDEGLYRSEVCECGLRTPFGNENWVADCHCYGEVYEDHSHGAEYPAVGFRYCDEDFPPD